MSGGGGGSSYRPPVQAAAPRVTPVPQSDIQPNWGPEFGAQPVQNPYVAGNTPSWMDGWFGMPSWGMDPFGQPLTQEQMMYQRPAQFDENLAAQQAPPAPPALAAPQNPFGSGMVSPAGFSSGRVSEQDYRRGDQLAPRMGYAQAISHGFTPSYEQQFNPQARYLDTCAREGGKMVNGNCQYG